MAKVKASESIVPEFNAQTPLTEVYSKTKVGDAVEVGNKMYINDGENGLLTPVGDKDALYRAMKRMIEEDGLATKCSVASRAINQLLTLEKITSKWIELV